MADARTKKPAMTGERTATPAPAEAPERAPVRAPTEERLKSLRRRVILVTGNGKDPMFEAGDLAVLDRKSIGRRTLTRLVERLAEAGAAGLVLNDDVLSDVPLKERSSLGDKLPLLVMGPEWASTKLLEPPSIPAPQRMSAFLRSVLRGDEEMLQAPDEFKLADPARVLVVTAHPDELAPLPLKKLEELVAAETIIGDPQVQIVSIDGMVAAILREFEDNMDPEGMGRAIIHRARSALLLSAITVGIGRAYPGLDGLRRSYREALWSATATELLWGGDRVTAFRELGIYGLLEPFVADSASADTADVERLLEHDRRNRGGLMPTVETFFALGSVGETAAALFVHRNTVTYRLRAVRRITGLDVLGDPDARLYLEVQIRLARLRGLLPARPPRPLRKVAARRNRS
jgi:hypothetical protein